MKILHTADWHLGKRLEGYSRLPEQVEVLEEIRQLADEHEVDAMIIAGDIFDTINPPVEATELLFKTVQRLSKGGRRPVIAIAGNHDSAQRIESPDPLARNLGILFTGYPESEIPEFETEFGIKSLRTDKGFVELSIPNCPPLRFILTPYANEARFCAKLADSEDKETELRALIGEYWKNLADQYCDEKGINLLMAHLFVMKQGGKQEVEPEGEKEVLHVGGAQPMFTADIPPQIQYTALGHLHRYHHISGAQGDVAYSGSPLQYSLSEQGQTKYALLIDIEPNAEPKTTPIALQGGKQVTRQQFPSVDEALQWLMENPNTFVELHVDVETFLEGADKKRLHQAHDGILAIVPHPTQSSEKSEGAGEKGFIDPTRSIDDLFQDYYMSKHGTLPDEEMMDLFKSIKK